MTIKEADGITGSCIFNLVPDQRGADIPGMERPKIPHDQQDRRSGHKKRPHKKYKKKKKN